MVFDDVQKTLTDLVAHPDTAVAEIPAFLESLKADYESQEASIKKVGELEERIRSLQDSNMKLFLMQTAPSAEKLEEPELTGREAVDAFVKEIVNK